MQHVSLVKTLGISYGMHSIIGDGKPVFNTNPGFHVKYRAFDENASRPALLLGINTQGKGEYTEIEKFDVNNDGTIISINEPIKRYEQKALGFFISLSKNWNFFGNLGFHIGINKNNISLFLCV